MPERGTTMPRADAESRLFFESMLPDDPRVQSRQMFGNVGGFVNGNMFMGLHGADLFVRLSEADRAELLLEEGAALFEPRSGRPMREYVLVPPEWRLEPDRVGGWVSRSLEWVGQMPPKHVLRRTE
jgi:TfoX/Sxy family transcriptional regulator of competence genes